jgi:hypothetical protein
MLKYFIQYQAPCPKCKRKSVDVVTTDQDKLHMLSIHFIPETFRLCPNSLGALS